MAQRFIQQAAHPDAFRVLHQAAIGTAMVAAPAGIPTRTAAAPNVTTLVLLNVVVIA
jgi:hypothetical protein